MIDSDDIVGQGREAWARIRAQERLSWDDWIAVGKALQVGRAICMKAAQVNSPKGGKYNYVAARWLADNGFSDNCAQERYRVVKIVEQIDEVNRWRDALPPEQRRRINHPSHWQTYLAFKNGKPRQQRHQPRPAARPAASGRPIFWPQDAIRRAATAMRECGSLDMFTLARRALEAAIRNEDDLLTLLASPHGRTAPHRSARTSSAAVMGERITP